MSAFSALQDTVLIQAGAAPGIAKGFSPRVRQHLAALAAASVVAIAMAPGAASAGPINANNCANVGAGVGGVLGAGLPQKNIQRVVGGILGAFGGAIVGDMVCRDNPPPQQQQGGYQNTGYNNTSRGPTPLITTPGAQSSQQNKSEAWGLVGGQRSPAALTFDQVERLDAAVLKTIKAKDAWVESVRDNRNVDSTDVQRQNFISARRDLSNLTMALASDSNQPRDVSRYASVVLAMNDMPTDNTFVSYRDLREADQRATSRLQQVAQGGAAPRMR